MTVLAPPGYTQGGTYSAKLDRMYINTVGYVPNLAASFSARQGFHSGRTPGVTNPSGMDVTITACSAVIANTFASASGDYLMVNDAAVTVTLAAASPTQNRYDIVGFQVKDNLFDSSGLNTAVPAVIQGSYSAGTPSDPVLPASFIPVVRAVVSAGATSPTIQSLVRRTASNGGVVRIANVTERAEITPFEGYVIWREDRDWLEVYDGTAWRIQGVAVCTSTADRDSIVTNPYSGQLVITLDTYTMWLRRGSAWERFPRGLLARSRRTTPSSGSASTAPVPVRRVDNLAVRAGQLVVVETSSLHPTSTVTSDTIRLEIRYSTSGVATTASPVLPGAQVFELFGNTTTIKTTYTPVGNETLSLLLCVARETGSGTVTLYADSSFRIAEIYVTEEGIDPGNTGVDL